MSRLLGLVFLIALAAAGCATPAASPTPATQPPTPGGTLQILLEGPYRTLDPQQETPPFGLRAAGPAYDTILKFEASDPLDSKIVGSLAERWEQHDDRTYVFSLRKDVKWHDGAPFTAEDARFTLDRIINPPKGIVSARRDWFTSIDRVEVADPHTLKIVLKRPQAAFLPFIAAGWTVLMPRHVLENDPEALIGRAIGTGPYKLEKVVPQVEGTLVRNEDYFMPGRPYLDGIRWITVVEPSAQIAAFRARRADFMQINNAAHSETVRNEMPGVSIQIPPPSQFVSLRLNHARPPFDDVRVRQAMHLAINRDEVIRGAVQGQGLLPSFMPPGGTWGMSETELRTVPGYKTSKDQDIATARKLLADAGHPNGFSTTMLLGQYPYVDSGALVVADNLKALGIHMEAEKTDPSSVLPRIQGKAFHTAPYLFGFRLDDPNDSLVANFRTGGGRNYEGFSNQAIDELLDRQAEALEPTQRKQLVQDLTTHLLQQASQIPLFWVKFEIATHPWMKGFVAHGNRANDYQFLDTWIDSTLKP